jgi:hypothetical protein
MKRLLIGSVVVLAVLAVGVGAAWREKGGHHGRRHKRVEGAEQCVKDANGVAVADANRPRGTRRRGHAMRKAFRKRTERLEAIREIAAEEGATKTVAALDEFIGQEKEHIRRMGKRMHERHREFMGEEGGRRGKRGGRGRRREAAPEPEAEG